MRSQLYWVGLTYVRRPLFWVATLLLLGMVVYGISTSRNNTVRSSYPGFQAEGLQVYSYEEFQKLQSEGRLKEIRRLDFMSLLSDKKRRPARWNEAIQGRAIHLDEINAQELIEECTQATEIEELVFGGLLPDLDLSWLSQFQKLRHFKTYSVPGKKPWVAQFEKLPDLERLSIGSCYSLEGLGRLAKLKNLQTLDLESIWQFSDRDLREISQLPQLRTLILKPHQVSNAPNPNEPKNSVTDAGLALLRDMPNLQTVYVNRFALERVRSILPNKRVLRANYSKSRIGNLLRIEFSLAILFAVLYFQITGQSSLFLGRIAPRFFPSHAVVPIGILAIAITLGTFCVSAGNSQMLPALSACMLIVAGMGWALQTLEGKTGMTGAALPASIGLGPLAILSSHDYFGPEIDAFLLGDFLGIGVVFLGLSCLLMVRFLRHLAQLPLRLAVSGKTLPVSLADINTLANANNKQNTQTHWLQKTISGILDQHVARGFHGNQPAQRISLWHAAVPGMSPSFHKALFTVLGILGLGLFIFFRTQKGPDAYLAMALIMPWLVGMLWLLFWSWRWHFRLKYFAHELLRPVSRRSLRSDFFRSLLDNLGTSLFITLPLASIAYFLWKDVAIEITPWTASIFFFSTGILILGAGVSASIALIRRSWLVTTMLFLLYFTCLLTFVFVGNIDFFARDIDLGLIPANFPGIIMLVTMALALLGSAMFIFAWRRFLKIEWGKSA